MSKQLHPFFPWQYADELKRANERSAAGIHLTRVGLLTETEAEDPSVNYRYDLHVADSAGLTESLYAKQGWEPVCRRGKWRWYRKKMEPGKPESEYTFFGPEKEPAIFEYLREIIRPLDKLRNLLLILTFILILIPSGITGGLTPRIGCVPLFLAIPVVTYAEKLRKVLGEDKRK